MPSERVHIFVLFCYRGAIKTETWTRADLILQGTTTLVAGTEVAKHMEGQVASDILSEHYDLAGT